MFDEFVGGAATEERPTSAAPRAAPAGNRFEEFVGGAPTPPPAKNAVDWSQYGKPRGELKAADPSWTQAAKWKLLDMLSGMGMKTPHAQHLSEGLVGVAGLNPVMGGILSGADLTHDLSRGNYGHAAMDAVGVIPGALAAKRMIRGPAMTPMADVPRGKGDVSFLPERGSPDPHGMGPYGVRGQQPQVLPYDENLTAARSAYRDTRYSPIEYHPNAMNDFVARAKQGLEHPELGFSPEVAKDTHAMMDRWVAQMGHRNTPITAQDWDTFRQQLRKLEGPDGAAGNHVAGWVDQYMTNPPPGAMIRGTQADLDQLSNTFDVARGNYRSGKTAEAVEKEIDRAGTKAGSKNSGLNVGNMTRDRMTGLTTTDAGEAKIFGARPDERAAINAVGEGDPWTNRLRNWSNSLGGGGGGGNTVIGGMAGVAGTGAGHMLGLDPVTSMGLGLATGAGTAKAGTMLRGMANERTVRAADDVVDMIRKNSPEYAARVRATPDIPDPYAMQRDAVAYALMPQAAPQAGKNIWDEAQVPYENREEQR